MKNTLLMAVIFATGLVCHSRADSFAFWYSGVGVEASGILTTGAYDSSFGGYQITGITGERNSVAIDSLVNNPNAPGTFVIGSIIFDNLLLTSTVVDYNGFMYTAGGIQYNAYLNTDAKYYDLTQAQAAAGDPGIQLKTIGFKAVPDGGATVVLLGFGFMALGLVRSRLSRNKAA
jgi:VPDSG-CTERM motif